MSNNNDSTTNYIKECSIVGYMYPVIVEFPSTKYTINLVVSSVLCCILIIPVVLLNGITAFTIFRSYQLKGKACHITVLTQSVADFTVGLLTLPLFAYLHLTEVYGTPDCVPSFVLSSIAFIPWGLSLASLCALTFERYMGVMYPIVHFNHVTKRMFLIYSGCVLLVTVVIVPLAVISATFYYIFCGIYAIVPFLLHTYCYSRILISTRKKLQQNCSSTLASKSEDKISSESTNHEQKRNSAKELKLAKSCALVVITFYVCCIPGEVLNIYYLERDFMIYRVVIAWYVVSLGVNTILNSVIFFWTRPILRKEAFKVLKGVCSNN